MPSNTSTPQGAAQAETKRALVLNMLRSKGGATLPALMKATGWQAHSVRGFFSGVVRKKLQLDLASDGEGEKRVYRIKPTGQSPASVSASKHRTRT